MYNNKEKELPPPDAFHIHWLNLIGRLSSDLHDGSITIGSSLYTRFVYGNYLTFYNFPFQLTIYKFMFLIYATQYKSRN
jgi:hypothetical protein